MDSEEDDDYFANSFDLELLNNLTNERILLSQKKLFKGIDPPFRKISMQEDDLLKNQVAVGYRKKSTFA